MEIKEGKDKINWCRRLVVKIKLQHRKDPIVNMLQLFAIFSVSIGLIVLVVFIIGLTFFFDLFGRPIDMSATGQVGDFIGGFIGSLWALTGVLLFYVTLRLQKKELSLQRKELRLQREEMRNNRLEFQINRLTNIIYKQIELSDSAIQKLTISTKVEKQEIKYHGFDAIEQLTEILHTIRDAQEKKYSSDSEKEKAVQILIAEKIVFLELNKVPLKILFNKLANYTRVVRHILMNDNIPIRELNDLKLMYFKNISSEVFLHLETLKIFIEFGFEIRSIEGKTKFFHPLTSVSSNLESIDSFKKEILTKESINKFNSNRELYSDTSLVY
jgi:hypothetical protein